MLTSNAFACSCAAWPEDPDQAMKEANEEHAAIFLGTVQSVRMLPGPDEVQETVFSVHASWKGTAGPAFTTTVSVACCICGYEFDEGVTYFVFAYQISDGTYRVSLCSPTVPKDYSESYVEALDRIKKNE